MHHSARPCERKVSCSSLILSSPPLISFFSKRVISKERLTEEKGNVLHTPYSKGQGITFAELDLDTGAINPTARVSIAPVKPGANSSGTRSCLTSSSFFRKWFCDPAYVAVAQGVETGAPHVFAVHEAEKGLLLAFELQLAPSP